MAFAAAPNTGTTPFLMAKIGLVTCPHDPCIFTGTIVDSQPPIYLGVYVDDFTYFLLSDKVERAVEHAMHQHLRVDFMGDVAWFLGCSYVWQCTEDNKLTVSITQTAKIESMLDEFDMSDCNATNSPYCSGMVIDRISKDLLQPDDKPHIVKPYQQLVGRLNWLSLCTWPELCVPVSLLSSHLHSPSSGHMDAAKQVLSWLSGSRNYGIRFTQGGDFAAGLVSWVNKDDPDLTALAQIWTDAN
jgi:hypothetical protein